jgi:hypothetical protein
MKKLEQYFRESDNNGAIDHALRANGYPDDGVKFYIHPLDINGDTLDYLVVGDTLIPREGKDMNFGQAIAAMKIGKKVCRIGWNGKGMFTYYVPANCYPPSTAIAQKEYGTSVPYNAYFAIKNVNRTVSTWVPSINDCLADDWMILEESV